MSLLDAQVNDHFLAGLLVNKDGFSTPARVLKATELVSSENSVQREVIKERVDERRSRGVCLDAKKAFASVVDQEDGLGCVKAENGIFESFESAAEDGIVSFEVGSLKPSDLHRRKLLFKRLYPLACPARQTVDVLCHVQPLHLLLISAPFFLFSLCLSVCERCVRACFFLCGR